MRSLAVTGAPGDAIAVHELTGEEDDVLLGAGRDDPHRDVLLVHAAGLHGHVWLPFVEHLPDRFRPLALDVRGHGASSPMPPGGLGWEELAGDVLAAVDGLDLRRPLAVGHSSGASLLLLAEQQRPGTFAGLFCIEPIGSPVDDPPAPRNDHPLAERARRRREVFPSRPAAFDAYASRPPFSAVAPDALHAYVEHGFYDLDDGGVRLLCRPEDEAAVYAHGLSHHAYRDLDRIRCPVVLAAGSRSQAVPPATLEGWAARTPQGRVEVLPGLGHLAPLEDPAAVAAAVVDAFSRW